MSARSAVGVGAALDAVQDIEGWLTPGQAARLFDAARALGARGGVGGSGSGGRPDGGPVIVEIGSFRGRSAVVLALAAPPAASIVCIDPHAGSDRGPQEIAADASRGDSDHEVFHANLARAGVTDRIRHVRAFSDAALDAVEGPVDLLYVDGAHRYAPALSDLRDWGARVPPGGRMLVHDSFSSIGVTLALLRSVVFARGWRYTGRERSLAEWVRSPNTAGSIARQLLTLPWFARNVFLKALIAAGLRSGPWPY